MDIGGPDFVYPPPALAAAAGGLRQAGRPGQDRSGGAAVLPADRHTPRPNAPCARRRPTDCCGRASTTRCGGGERTLPRRSRTWRSQRRWPGRGPSAPRSAVWPQWRLLEGTGPPAVHCVSKHPSVVNRRRALGRREPRPPGSAGRGARPRTGCGATQTNPPPPWLGAHAGGDRDARLGNFARELRAAPHRHVGTVVEGRGDAGGRCRDRRPRAGVGSAASSTATRWSQTCSLLCARPSAAGRHTLTIARPGASLAPGDGGAATLAAIFLVPAGPAGEPALRSVPISRWRTLCGHPLQWVEVVSAG